MPNDAPFKLTGLARHLVLDNIISEEDASSAITLAKKEGKAFVSYIVSNKLAKSSAIAMSASKEFGIPLIDVNAIEADLLDD